MINLIYQAAQFDSKTAIVANDRSYSYHQLLSRAKEISSYLLQSRQNLNEARIAFIINPGFEYVATQWGIWLAGGIAVPLCVKHPFPSLQYVIQDTEAECLIYSSDFDELIEPFKSYENLKVCNYLESHGSSGVLPQISSSQRAMILYTSGTTGNPKGVVSTHDTIKAQAESLINAWSWSSSDSILNVLPLHHIHGILNATCCPLAVGASVHFLPKFKPEAVFKTFLSGSVNIFMAVPTIYFKLIKAWETFSQDQKRELKNKLKAFRLMVSGSAALPVSVLKQWLEISGHTLLERYGMTEIGMAISNPLHGERRPGYIGQPLPNVSVRLQDESGVIAEEKMPGEIQIKGPTVFKEYWKRPEATQDSFTDDGWFLTGDTALVEEGYYRILGRNSVDIIKSGGYKISALEIEEVLRKYKGIKDCGVVGVPSEEWGETIAAALVGNEEEIDLEELSSWLRTLLPNYKIPRQYRFLEDLPRNVMGKVTKKELKNLF